MNIREENHHHKHLNKHKEKVLNALLLISTLAVIIFALVNYQRGKYLLATIELAAAILAFSLWISLQKNNTVKHFQRIALSYVLIFCAFLLVAFWQLDIFISAYTFALLMPLLAHLLLGNRLGFVITAVFLTLTTLIFYHDYQNHVIFTQLTGFYNIVVATLFIWGLVYSYERANENNKDKLISLASRDFLTGLYNRSMLNTIYQRKLKKSIKNHQPLSMLVADLDHFKKINDLYGHKAGDDFIQEFAGILQQHSGSKSECFRVGGEEFCVILSNTDIEACYQIAENIRQATEKIRLETDQQDISVTVSIGIVTCYDMTCNMSDLLKIADKNLYQAKHQGRNQVVR